MQRTLSLLQHLYNCYLLNEINANVMPSIDFVKNIIIDIV